MRKYIGIAILALCVLSGLWAINNAVYHQAANEICVVQSPVDGTLTVSFDPGMHSLWGGHVTRYPRRGQIDFDGKHQSDGALHIGALVAAVVLALRPGERTWGRADIAMVAWVACSVASAMFATCTPTTFASWSSSDEDRSLLAH